VALKTHVTTRVVSNRAEALEALREYGAYNPEGALESIRNELNAGQRCIMDIHKAPFVLIPKRRTR